MAFIAIELAIQLTANLAPIEDAVRLHRKKLADEIARSSDSIGLNLGEGRHRRGGDRGHAYRIAHGSAGELTVALRQARARRLITEQQYADVDRILDQLRAILWRLTH